jgi:hypothetical protein
MCLCLLEGLEGMVYTTRFSRIFKKEAFFERPQAEFQIDAMFRIIHKLPV